MAPFTRYQPSAVVHRFVTEVFDSALYILLSPAPKVSVYDFYLQGLQTQLFPVDPDILLVDLARCGPLPYESGTALFCRVTLLRPSLFNATTLNTTQFRTYLPGSRTIDPAVVAPSDYVNWAGNFDIRGLFTVSTASGTTNLKFLLEASEYGRCGAGWCDMLVDPCASDEIGPPPPVPTIVSASATVNGAVGVLNIGNCSLRHTSLYSSITLYHFSRALTACVTLVFVDTHSWYCYCFTQSVWICTQAQQTAMTCAFGLALTTAPYSIRPSEVFIRVWVLCGALWVCP